VDTLVDVKGRRQRGPESRSAAIPGDRTARAGPCSRPRCARPAGWLVAEGYAVHVDAGLAPTARTIEFGDALEQA